jgi:hypothetical protein
MDEPPNYVDKLSQNIIRPAGKMMKKRRFFHPKVCTRNRARPTFQLPSSHGSFLLYTIWPLG